MTEINTNDKEREETALALYIAFRLVLLFRKGMTERELVKEAEALLSKYTDNESVRQKSVLYWKIVLDQSAKLEKEGI